MREKFSLPEIGEADGYFGEKNGKKAGRTQKNRMNFILNPGGYFAMMDVEEEMILEVPMHYN